MDLHAALAYLDDHTNLEGGRAARFGPSMPIAGATSGLSLEPMEALLAALGDPHRAYKTIHITGTNGKGSTARFVSAIIAATDLSVGTYTSPNIESINERIVWAGAPIADEDFANVLGLIASVEPLLDVVPSRFELLTAAALVWFAEVGVDVAVVEVGLLGRFDATNVVESDVAVITNIGKDHTHGREGWEVDVATEKAGIIKPSSHLVVGFPSGDFGPIFEAEGPRAAWTAGTEFVVEDNRLAVGGRAIDLVTPGGEYDQLFVPFHGAHQGDNAATAVAAVEAFFGRPTPRELLDEAFATVELPARFEVVGRDPTLILDGAHNPDGARAAAATLEEAFARLGSWVLVIGMLAGRDPGEMLDAFGAADFDAVICTTPDWSRAVPAQEVADAAAARGLPVEVVPRPVDALHRALAVTASEDLVLVSGSIYVVGDIRSLARQLTSDDGEEGGGGDLTHDR